MSTLQPDPAEISRFLALIHVPGEVRELRALEVPDGRISVTFSGYFDDPEVLAREAANISERGARGVYVTLNPVNATLLARAENHVVRARRGGTTSDGDILGRRFALVDIDVERPAGISTTDEEHEKALVHAQHVEKILRENRGFPRGMLIDSGNCAQIIYAIDLPAEDGDLVARFLDGLALLFSGDGLKIDVSVSNAARITKVPGTIVRKGDDVPERPHRTSRILDAPDCLEPIAVDKLRSVAAVVFRPRQEHREHGRGDFNCEAWLQDHGLAHEPPFEWNGRAGRALVYVLPQCPFNAAHNRGEARVVKFHGGGVAFGCFHESCKDKDWHALRDLVEPGWSDRSAGRLHAPPVDAGANLDEPRDFMRTDLGNAERLLARHGADARYVSAWGAWILWTGIHWKRDDGEEILKRAADTVREIYGEAAAAGTEDERKRLAAHAVKSESKERLLAMIRLARPFAHVDAAHLDSDPFAFNCLNGTLDLKTGRLRAHKKEDLCTKLAPVAYSPDATSPIWEKFLLDSTGGPDGDPEIADFLQRAAGYSLSGDTGEEKLFLIHGPGGSGKSTFLEALKATLGDYARTADFEAFLKRQSVGGPRNDIARLAGARLVASIEVDEGKALAEGLVKMLTGGDTVAARFMYTEAFEFKPTFKLWLAANTAPKMSDVDDAMWRRVLLVPFTHAIPKASQNPKVKAELRDPEKSGAAILNWCVRGCLSWQRDGLGVPGIVEEATQELRDEMDPTRTFFEENCRFFDGAWCYAGALRKAYETWAKDSGTKDLVGAKAWAARLRARGCTPDFEGHKNARVWRGVGLLAVENGRCDRAIGCDRQIQ